MNSRETWNWFGAGVIVYLTLIAGCGEMRAELTLEGWHKVIDALRPLCEPIDRPGPADWLAHHQEPGQTFGEYVAADPIRLNAKRKTIYVQPLGDFSEKQQAILKQTAEFLGCFYNCSVVTRKTLPDSVVPAAARRTHPTWGDKQMLTSYILDDVLRPRLPDDAAAYLAFTASDLWPGEGWNFVFGQASLRERVGVWSLYRFGNPDAGKAAELLCLRRTLKLAIHETGHMFSLQHCTAYKCGMCGSNHLAEADRRPLHFCAECMAKVCWATGADPAERAEVLEAFLNSAGLREDADFYRTAAMTLKREGPTTRPGAPTDARPNGGP